MDAWFAEVHSGLMTAFLIVTLLLLLAVAGPLVGTDSRARGSWTPSEPDQPLWAAPRTRATR